MGQLTFEEKPGIVVQRLIKQFGYRVCSCIGTISYQNNENPYVFGIMGQARTEVVKHYGFIAKNVNKRSAWISLVDLETYPGKCVIKVYGNHNVEILKPLFEKISNAISIPVRVIVESEKEKEERFCQDFAD